MSFETLPLTIIFLLPGFFVFYTRQFLYPAGQQKLETFPLGLLSLGYSVIISLVEALVGIGVLRFFQVDTSVLLRDLPSVAQSYPLITLAVTLAWVLIGAGLALVLGIWDPYLHLLRRINQKRRHFDTDIWFNLLEIERRIQSRPTVVVATAHMKNGDIYSGYLKEFELQSHDDGTRDFILYHVFFCSGDSANPCLKQAHLGKASYVLLNTRDVQSIDVIFDTSNEGNRH